eukprot:INCI18805.2.p1 GENE.INCI18805.2~~INCI18805.2.p1  ORF type:complete len:579 (+),score=168.11 INCI18805.2:219-1955(+)
MSTAQRLSTAQRQVNTNGVGLQNSVKVQGRPVTGQGMSGIQTRAGTAGPRRTIQDSSYYVSALTSKNTELQTEIRKMQNEIDAHEKDGNLYKRLEKKYETLIDEVRELEGTLADYNLAKDKARMTTDPQQIKNFQMQLKEKNANFEREADNVYRMKQAQIAKTAELKERIDDIKREEAAKIEELGFEEKNRFLALQEEKESAQVRIDQGKAKMEDMKRHIKRLEDDIKFNTYINEYKDLQKRLSRLEKEKESAETEANWLSMDPEQARQELLQKVKSSNAEVKATQAKIEKTQKANEQARKHLEELTSSIDEHKGDNEDSQKYELLFERDRIMTEFLKNFESAKEKAQGGHARTREVIVELLKHIANSIAHTERLGENAPSRKDAQQAQKEHDFKNSALQAAKDTHERLQAELRKRRGELDKINGLDTKIRDELKSLATKMERMKEELPVLKNIDKLKEEAMESAELLKEYKELYHLRSVGIKSQIGLVSAKYEKLKSFLQSDKYAKELSKREKQMRNHEKLIFESADFIASKSLETDYLPLRDRCLRSVTDLNKIIIKNTVSNVAMADGGEMFDQST